MRVEGTYTFPGATNRVFATLMNPDILARAIPGCERFIQFGPATDDGQTAYEVRLRLGQRHDPYTIYARVAATRQPDYVRLELHGNGPSGALTGDGSLDLVEQGDHTVVAYRLTITGPDLPASASDAAQRGNLMAQATCARLSSAIYDSASGEPVWLPGAAPAHDRAHASTLAAAENGSLDAYEPVNTAGLAIWAERAAWLGAGLALGLSAIALTLAVARRIGDRDSLAQ